MSNFKVPKGGGNPGVADPIATQVVYFKESDVLTWPVVDADGVTVTGDIILKATITAGEIYVTPKTQEAKVATDGEIDQKGSTQTFTAKHPGENKDINKFLETYKNEGLILLIPHASGKVRAYGWKNNPMYLKDESVNGASGVGHTLEFTSSYPANVPYFYEGVIPAITAGI